jgi:diaminohydroxyphosphoribosylaminopyrimidine deaminase/5-amino-6-(5-phosphoribosylamino)uracil reductase
MAPTLLGGPLTAVTDIGVRTISEQARLRFEHVEVLGDDVLLIARPRTPFASEPTPTKEDD